MGKPYTNDEWAIMRKAVEDRRALKAAGKLPKIKIVLQPYQTGGKPHDRGADRPEGWKAPPNSRTEHVVGPPRTAAQGPLVSNLPPVKPPKA